MAGEMFFQRSGFNEVGELNNIILVYPQINNLYTMATNPNGCFDWWGYNTQVYGNIFLFQVISYDGAGVNEKIKSILDFYFLFHTRTIVMLSYSYFRTMEQV